MKKRIISFLLVILLAAALCPSVFAAEESLTNAAQVTDMATSHPITISEWTLEHKNSGSSEPVYLITLHGMGTTLTNHNNIVNYFLSLVPLNNSYFYTAKAAALKTIPKGATVLIAGHSLGGMIGQMLAGDRQMQDNYKILNVLACGSPYLPQLKREGSLHRLANRLDPIPIISSALFGNYLMNVSFEFSRPYSTLTGYHTNYEDESVWGKYDCLGVKYGDAILTNMRAFHSFPLAID